MEYSILHAESFILVLVSLTNKKTNKPRFNRELTQKNNQKQAKPNPEKPRKFIKNT